MMFVVVWMNWVCLVDLNVFVCVFGCLIDLVGGLLRLVGCLLVMLVGWC